MLADFSLKSSRRVCGHTGFLKCRARVLKDSSVSLEGFRSLHKHVVALAPSSSSRLALQLGATSHEPTLLIGVDLKQALQFGSNSEATHRPRSRPEMHLGTHCTRPSTQP